MNTNEGIPAEASIEAEGWKITDLATALFPGGPSAYRVDSPMGSFCFGMSLKPGPMPKGQDQTALISSFGQEVDGYHNIFEGDAAKRAEALTHVCALLVAKGTALEWGDPIVSTEFTEGSDVQMEIF